MEREKPSYYAIIPADIRYNQDLPPNAKLLYGEITCLCNERGYCWAKNKYFADLYEVNPSTVSRWIGKLVAIGKLTSEIVYEEDKKTVSERILRLSDAHPEIPMDEIVHTPPHKKVKGGIGKKVKVNSTSVNTTSKNKKGNGKTPIPADDVELKFRPAYDAYPGSKGEYWQMYHSFQRGCKTSGLDLADELDLLLPAIENQIEERRSVPVGKFKPEWRSFGGWLGSAHWRYEPPAKEPEPDDDFGYTSEAAQIQQVKIWIASGKVPADTDPVEFISRPPLTQAEYDTKMAEYEVSQAH